MSKFTLSIRPATGGLRKFAVTTAQAVAQSSWCSGQIECQSDQTWDASVWCRIADRGYVCRLDGDGQWSNQGDHGRYIGTGATAEAAFLDAWAQCEWGGDNGWVDTDCPRSLIAPMRDYDALVKPAEVE